MLPGGLQSPLLPEVALSKPAEHNLMSRVDSERVSMAQEGALRTESRFLCDLDSFPLLVFFKDLTEHDFVFLFGAQTAYSFDCGFVQADLTVVWLPLS